MTYAPATFEVAMSNGLGGNALQEIFDLSLTQGQGRIKHCPLHHVPYVPSKFEVAMANGLGDAFTRIYII